MVENNLKKGYILINRICRTNQIEYLGSCARKSVSLRQIGRLIQGARAFFIGILAPRNSTGWKHTGFAGLKYQTLARVWSGITDRFPCLHKQNKQRLEVMRPALCLNSYAVSLRYSEMR
jgi:hypothetical protein